MVFLKEFFKKDDFDKKNQQTTKKHKKLPSMQTLTVDYSSAFILHLTFFSLVGNQDIHKSMDEFEFWSDLITDFGDICP